MAISKRGSSSNRRRTQPKANPDKDRFLAVGGGPADGLLWLARLRRIDKSTTPHTTHVVGDLPDTVPFPTNGGAYVRRYDPEEGISMYVWTDDKQGAA